MRTRIRIARVAWLNTRLTVAFTRATRDLLGGDLVSSLLVPAISEANVGHLDQHPDETLRHLALDADYPDALRRPANVMSIAASLEIPRETARYKLETMLESGLVHRQDGGIVLRTETLTSERFLPSIPRYLEAIGDMVEDLGRISACGLRPGQALVRPIWPVAGAVLRMGTAHVLRCIGHLRRFVPGLSLMDTYLVMAILHETAAHLRPYPGALDVPDGMVWTPTDRPAVSGLHLARTYDIPVETVRRRLKGLETGGLIVRNSGGVALNSAVRLPGLSALQERNKADTRQLIWRLCLAGAIPASDKPL